MCERASERAREREREKEGGNDVAPNGPVAGIKLDRVTELLGVR